MTTPSFPSIHPAFGDDVSVVFLIQCEQLIGYFKNGNIPASIKSS